MKKIISPVMILFLFTVPISSQDTLPPLKRDSLSNSVSQTESLLKKEQAEIFQPSKEQNSRNPDTYIKEQKEGDKKQKKQLYLRLAMGIFFFILFIFGLLRRRKKNKAVSSR